MSNTITRHEVKQFTENNADKTWVIEALPESYFEQGHLPTAINIPMDKIDHLLEQYHIDKSDRLVIYCASEACQNSSKMANIIRSRGYKHVYEYSGGKADWVDAGFELVTD